MVMRRDLSRFLPERSQFLLLIGVFVVLFAAGGFFNLALTKSEALAERRAAQDKYDGLLNRNGALKYALGEAQQDRHIESIALRFFGLVYPGVTVITAAPENPAAGAEADQAGPTGPPYWEQWFEKLFQP